MTNIDLLFNDLLHYISKWKSGETPEPKNYFKDKPYNRLWDSFLDSFFKGVCPLAMQTTLEHEKWKIMKNDVSEDEALETILLEKLLYYFYLGDDKQIAELTNNFASNQLCAKYAVLLDQLWNSKYADNSKAHKTETSCEASLTVLLDEFHTTDGLNQTPLEQCFLSIQMEIDSLLEIQKIELLRKMLKLHIAKESIFDLFPELNPEYLNIINSAKDDSSYDIYIKLFNQQLVNIKPPVFNYKNLNKIEVRIYQLLQHYFMT